MIRKLEKYEEILTVYPESVTKTFEHLSEILDDCTIEDVRILAETTYKEGFKDGLLFMDWLKE